MYHVDISNTGSYAFEVSSKGYNFQIDMKGVDGITPPDTLLASLGSCIGVYLRKYADTAGITMPAFNISLDAEFDKDPPVCFRKIKVNIDLQGVPLDPRRAKSLIEFIKNCPVHNTLKNDPEVDINIS